MMTERQSSWRTAAAAKDSYVEAVRIVNALWRSVCSSRKRPENGSSARQSCTHECDPQREIEMLDGQRCRTASLLPVGSTKQRLLGHYTCDDALRNTLSKGLQRRERTLIRKECLLLFKCGRRLSTMIENELKKTKPSTTF
jgi:hypothetical protein